MIDYIAIGRKIKMFRKKSQKTQYDLAEELNVSSKYISAIERGVAKISLSRLDEIAYILNVTIIDILSDSDTTHTSYGYSEIAELTKLWNPKQKEILIKVIATLNKSQLI